MSILDALKILEAPVESIDSPTTTDLPLPPHADKQVATKLLTAESIIEPAGCPPYSNTPTPTDRDTPSGYDEDY